MVQEQTASGPPAQKLSQDLGKAVEVAEVAQQLVDMQAAPCREHRIG